MFLNIIWCYLQKIRLIIFIKIFLYVKYTRMIDIFKLISIGSEFSLTRDTWCPLTYRFFTAVSKKLLNSFDKLFCHKVVDYPSQQGLFVSIVNLHLIGAVQLFSKTACYQSYFLKSIELEYFFGPFLYSLLQKFYCFL